MKPIRSACLALFSAILIACSSSTVFAQQAEEGASAASQKSFEDSLRGKTVELKEPLYTVFSAVRRNRAPVANGITVLTPDKGTFFRIVELGPFLDVSDSDPQRLVEKIAGRKEAAGLPTPRLLTYKPGTRMKVRGFEWGIAMVEIHLDDELADEGIRNQTEPTTKVTVMWPTVFSSAFGERPQIEALLSKVFEIK